jgi:hypothetical protein
MVVQQKPIALKIMFAAGKLILFSADSSFGKILGR